MQGIFPGYGPNVPENVDTFQSQDFAADDSLSMPIAIVPDTSAMTLPNAGGYSVMGGNKSANKIDMVDVKDEYGQSGQRPMTSSFEKKYFPYRYIGIKYFNSAGTGTVTFYYSQVQDKVKI